MSSTPETAPTALGPAPFTPRAVRRATAAGALGNLIEYYDFSVYSYVAVVIAPQFFPSGNPAASLLAVLAVYGTAFVARLFGGLFFGWLGDKAGRRTALVSSVICMGAGASVTGMLPTYAQIGVLAPILLLIARLVQGFSTGGEAAGSITYVYESAPPRRRAVLGAWNYFGSNLGFVVSAAATGLVFALTTKAQMSAWGWRIPFFAAIPLTLICLWARLRLEDSPEFVAAAKKSQLPAAPIREALATHRKPMAQVLGVTIAQGGCTFLALTYVNIYLSQQLHYDTTHVQWLSALAVLAGVTLMLPAGWLAGRFGSRGVLMAGFAALLAAVYPLMMLMDQHNLALAGVAYVLLMAGCALVQAPVASLYPSLFPGRVRFSGMAIGYNLGTVLAGGTSPFIAAYLVNSTGNLLAPAYFVMTVCVVGILTLLTIRKAQLTR